MAQAQAEKHFPDLLSRVDGDVLTSPDIRSSGASGSNAEVLAETGLSERALGGALTPLMVQYQAVKADHKDCLLFFRLGDFYELFFEDAVQASKALDIALTRRGQHQGQDIPMCGVPAHAYEGYLAKLIRHGFRVAICEQTESPADAKKRGPKSIVTRNVIRIVTPGTLTEDSLLDARMANNLVTIAGMGDEMAMSWIDLTCGKPMTQTCLPSYLGQVLARLDASEILVPQRLVERADLTDVFLPWKDRVVAQANGRFDYANAERRLQAIYGVREITAFGDFTRAEITALGALLDYVELTQKGEVTHFVRPEKLHADLVVAIDPSTRRNLELTRTLAGEKEGSLLATLDRTMTGAGARLLTSHLVAPLLDVAAIENRLDAVAFALSDRGFREQVRSSLRQVPDLERCLTRLCLGRGGPRDLAAVRDALAQAARLRVILREAAKTQNGSTSTMPAAWVQHQAGLEGQDALCDLLRRALAADLPYLARDGNFIALGYAAELDDLIILRDDSRQLIAGLQQRYADMSGVSGLKIRHNNVLGYYIEVTPLHAEKLSSQPAQFIHRQTLATAARFTTIELGELERKIKEAAERALTFELRVFDDLVKMIVGRLAPLRAVATTLAEIDVATSLGELAAEQNYVRPIVDRSLAFRIQGGRHPVVEQALASINVGATFIANDCDLAPEQKLWLLTGPNMAGKSTFLRQNALIALMAQMGSFVPARSAHIGVIDRLFSRVGASDDLARGHSTFMVEMVETAAILNQAGERALVILDEIGRGTATYDGLSIAWATIEHLHEVNRCRSLFATHYHELTELKSRLSSMSCHTMRIKEWEREIVFLHEVIDGVADRSYGIHVARMAGLPSSVLVRAEAVLQSLEEKSKEDGTRRTIASLPAFSTAVIETARAMSPDLVHFLDGLKPDELSPKQALDQLYALQALLRRA